MTILEIRSILESPYDRKVWKNFLQTQFTNNKLNVEDRTIALSDKIISKQCLSLGNYEINEYTKIGIFEVELNEKVNITRNRVALRNIIKDLTKQVAGAMVVFVQGNKWRFSYVSKWKVKNTATNEIQEKETAPKRYTYLFGKNEKALTAAVRFDKLIQKQKESIFQFLSLDDFEEAFSVEKLSKEFFANYKNAYEDFVQFLTGKRYAKKGSKYAEQIISEPDWQLTALFGKDEKQARDFCKRMMGRIVFLYFIQKKGWLAVKQNKKWGEGNQNYLYELFKNSKQKDDFYARELVPLFFTRLNNEDSENPARDERFPYLNGGLFDDTQDRKYNKLHLPENIFQKLFETFNNYNFTIYEDAPDEHTVAVDPEMLGHIFENLLEDNKDKGAYYTPKEIVHYMCKESLKAYLIAQDEHHFANNELAKRSINKILQQQELDSDEKQYAEKNAYKIIDALEQVKICDPAIGSGAFPMGLLQEIFNAQVYLQELKGFKKAKTDADIKKHIIEESIYGVDIDAGAVDIARLRFWLSLVVDEQEPQPLPNLDFKIVCANTLIPLGELTDNDMEAKASLAVKELEKIRHDFFNVSSEEKLKLERQFKKVQTDLLNLRELTTKENYSVYTNLYEFNPFDFESLPCSWFDPWWMFGVKDGFDIVIGNPPYIKEPTNRKAFDGFRGSKYYQGKMDLWYGFACIMLDNLKKDTGILTFIATNNWVTNAGASKFRNKVSEDAKIMQLIDFGNYKIFESADIQTMIMLFKANNNEVEYTFDYRKFTETKVELEDVIQLFTGVYNEKTLTFTPAFNRTRLKDKSFLFSEGGVDSILNDILNASNFKLDGKLEIAQGIVAPQDFVNKTSFEELDGSAMLNEGIFYLTDKEKEHINLSIEELELVKPFYSTTELDRYYGNNENKYWVIYTDSSFKNPSSMRPYPNLKRHLDRFQKVITSDNKPYGLHRARNEHFFTGEKIISLRKCAIPTFTYTDFDCYVSQTYFVIKTQRVNQKYLTAILNSKLIAFWLRHKGKMQGFQYQVDKAPLEELPLIKTIHERVFALLVNYILLQKKLKSDTTFFERIIDAMVYELYFPETVKEGGAGVLNYLVNLPEWQVGQDIQNLKIIEKVQKELSDPKHPINTALLKLFTIEEINIIEGRK
ncbi:TaqI restriction endonuclease [Mucilaginibacter oryzae]|uniref:site-specific DNA-methyltransferase (adenine-specific) n=1 Tax=Mucilaginibacter oryzae TaxID=468058 RepID=A0A316H642_9SPHI|nr:N-6 DNA methylase [Mucilaginibacter oryzae]PWK76569.1 TaqI restriction endonuclease [Mucilaginibacter oryzae]